MGGWKGGSIVPCYWHCCEMRWIVNAISDYCELLVAAVGSLVSLWRSPGWLWCLRGSLVLQPVDLGHELWRQDEAWTFNVVDHT